MQTTVDFEMELIAKLYGYMDKEEKAAWSLEEAEKLVEAQKRYEQECGGVQLSMDACEIFEIIAEFIAQDAEEDNDEA